jgi:hypothetical protein
VAQALEAGVDGVEVWHPQHDEELRRRLSRLVERSGLLATGGSDYHGVHKPGVRVGSVVTGSMRVMWEALDGLQDRLALLRT